MSGAAQAHLLADGRLHLHHGPIDIVAQAFGRLGSSVTVIQRSGQILSKEDKDMADTVMNTMQAEGVTFHLGTSVIEINEKNNMKEITFKDQRGDTQEQQLEEQGKVINHQHIIENSLSTAAPHSQGEAGRDDNTGDAYPHQPALALDDKVKQDDDNGSASQTELRR